MKRNKESKETPKRGPGRPTGSVNKRTLALRDEIDRMVEGGEGDPPEVVLFKLANDKRVSTPVRQSAASSLMPYIHPRLNSTDLKVTEGVPLRIEIVRREKG